MAPPQLPLPNLKALQGTPALYVMTLGYVLLLAAIVYLTNGRAEHLNKENIELVRLLQICLDKKTAP